MVLIRVWFKNAKNFLWAAIFVAELFALTIDGNIFRSHLAHTGFELPSDLNCFRTNGALALGKITAATAAKTCAFMYPPPFLLIAAPLSWLSPILSYTLWNAAAIAILILAARAVKLSWLAVGLGLISPPSLYCMAIGQTGEIISALLILSLGLASSSPLLAGIIAGCLVVKPQFSVLLPICYLASRNWRALSASVLTATLLCLLSAWLFGFGSWRHFFSVETTIMRSVLNQPWPQPFQGIMISIFMMLRSLGADLPLSYATQTGITIIAAFATWHLWSPGSKIKLPVRLMVTLCLVPLATPYAYVYDISGIALVLAGYAEETKWQALLPVSAFWIFTSFYIPISMISFLTGGILLLILAIYIWPAMSLTASGKNETS